MADLCCSFSFILPLFLPPKQYFSSALHSHNSRFSTIQRRSSHLPLLLKPSPLAASASDTVLISTHKHSDGSIIFRFGDPSEVEKNVEMEESIIIKEEIEGEDTDESRMVQVKEGEDETKGTASVLTEASDRGDSIVTISNTLIAVEGESEISEKSLATPVDIKLPVVASSKEIEGISSLDLVVEQIETLDGLNEENKDSSPVEASIPDESSQMENTTVEVSNEESLEETSNVTFTSEESEISSIPCVEVGQQDVNVEECRLNKEDGDSPADASILDQSSDVVDNVSTVALLEKESDDISSSDIDADQTERVETGIDGDYEDGSSDVESGIPAAVLLENETNGDTSTSAIEIEPTGHLEERINEEEYEDSVVDTSVLDKRDEVLNNTNAALSEIEAADVTSAHEDSPVDASVLDKSSEVENGISAVVLLENETDGDTPTSDIEIEPTGNVEERISEEYEDSLVATSMLDKRDEVLNNTEAALSENEAADITSAHYEDSPVDASVLDKSSEMVYGTSAVVLLKKETDGNTSTCDIEIESTGNVEEGKNKEYDDSLVDMRSEVKEAADVAYAPDIDTEYTGNVEQGLDEVHEKPSSVHAENSPEVEICITAQEFSEKETADTTTAVALKTDPVVSALDAGADQGGLETVITTNGVPISELQIAETEIHDEKTGDDRESFGDDLVSLSSDSETAMSLYEVTEVPNLQEELQNLATEESTRTDMDNNMVVEMQNETDDESPSMEAAMAAIGSEEQASGSGSGLSNETVGYESEKDIIQLLTVSPQLEADSMLKEETGEADSILEEKTGEANSVLEEKTGEANSVPEKETGEANSVLKQKTWEADSVLEEEIGEADSMLKEETGEANSVLEKETGEANSVLKEETRKVDSMLEKKTGAADSVLEEETGEADSMLEKETAEAELMLEEKTGEANSVLEKETGEANSVLKEETGEADSMLEKETAEADLMLEEKTGEANSVLEKDTEEANSVLGEAISKLEEEIREANSKLEEEIREANSILEQETGKANSVLEEVIVVTDSVLEEDTGTETVEEPRKHDGSENQTVGGDLAEASVHEVTAPESIEYTIMSQGILTTDFVLSSGAALLPHPSKVLTGGEDAYFIADQTWLGVADGVSQWSLEGPIPGGYAQELIENCEKLISDCSGNSINNPIELLNLSVAQTHSSGSSTVLIAQFDGQALHVANVGDSGFIILRHSAVYKRSSPMHHVFSLPVRIERGDDPSSLAQLYRVDLEEEDIIVTATDGLFDNLYDQEILLIAIKSLADGKTPKEIAELLAKKAQEVGSSAFARSPFADEAQAAGFPAYSGGMLDDVVVMVSVVRRR